MGDRPRRNREMVNGQQPDALVGRAMTEALVGSAWWRHRKVESLRLLEGERGRRRISVDCTPPADPALAYYEAERGAAEITDISGPIMVPIAMITKGPIRNFDIRGDAAALPVLGRKENGEIAWAALCHLFSLDLGVQGVPDALADVLHDIVQSPPTQAPAIADELLATGTAGGLRCFQPGTLSADVTALVRDLAVNFLLIALIPAEQAGIRQLIKFSFHWRIPRSDGSPWLTRIAVAAGARTDVLRIETYGAADAASYHLEVHAPPGLVCCGLVLPDRPDGSPAGAADEAVTVVAHAVGSYPEGPPQNFEAQLQLKVPLRGLRLMATVVACLTAIVFIAVAATGGLRGTLEQDTAGSVAILLAAPAIVLALLARPGENILAARLLFPLRIAVMICAGLLAAGAASFVAQIRGTYLSVIWVAGAVVAGVIAVGLVGTAVLVREPE